MVPPQLDQQGSSATTVERLSRLSRDLPGTPPAPPVRIVHLGADDECVTVVLAQAEGIQRP